TASATPKETTDLPVLRDNAFTSGDKITKAESTKIGIDTMKPAIANAHSSFFLPTALINEYASVSAAPEISSNLPIITPKPITIPIEPSVLPNPAEIVSATAAGAIPPINPAIDAAIINATKA